MKNGLFPTMEQFFRKEKEITRKSNIFLSRIYRNRASSAHSIEEFILYTLGESYFLGKNIREVEETTNALIDLLRDFGTKEKLFSLINTNITNLNRNDSNT